MTRLVVLVFATLLIRNVSCECYDEKGGDANDHVCIPGHFNIGKAPLSTITATSTCGDPPATACRLKPLNGCEKCNSSDPKLRHPVEYIVDNDFSTYWQSETWWEWYQTIKDRPIQVNVTLTFNKSFDATGLVDLTFASARPFGMILEKSSDFGATWTVLQYYASDCQKRFNLPKSEPMDYRQYDLKAYCTEEYSQIAPQRGGKVLFDFKSRYDSEKDFFRPEIQDYIHVTNLRFQLQYPASEGFEVNDKSESVLNQLFYAISNLDIVGRCRCNGHASFCLYKGITQCEDCRHFTTGINCDKCLPLYNNRTWMPATSRYDPNPCQKCECNEHADACEFNKNLGYGVCQDCKHDTTGHFCEECQDKFYRNTSLSLKHPEICLPCDCFQKGILNNGTCHVSTGQCECRQNVTGRRCDQCVDTYYGYTVDPVGHCTACNCVQFGTGNGSLNCHQTTGQCFCKPNIKQRTCSQCKDGFYDFPSNITMDCLKCDCDYGGSASGICDKINGNCVCRKNIQGMRCTEVLPGYFTGSFTFFKTEAEQSSGNYLYTSNTNDLSKYFTGTGYAKIIPGQYIDFKVNSGTDFNGFIMLRYTDPSQANIGVQVKVTATGTATCVGISKTFTITNLQKAKGQAWKSSEALSICKGQQISFNVSYSNLAPSNASIEIDSLILYPDIKDTRIYKIANAEGDAHGFDKNIIVSCWTNWTTIAGASQSQPICQNISFSAMAQVLDGALPCGCSRVGSLSNTTCDHHGGQCQCKPGVTGRTCDQCMPGYYNLTSEGCTACNCSDVGSHHPVCNANTGQCPCKPGVVTRTCDRCNHTYYGFNTGKGCVECKCNASGSVDLQCHGDTGVCPCKNSTDGDKCDRCRHGYYNYTTEGCQPCHCDKDGSSSEQCNLQTGKCECKDNVKNTEKCNMCKQGFYNRDRNNPSGCTPCFCYGRSSNCTSANGYVKSVIERKPNSTLWQVNKGGVFNGPKLTKDGTWRFDFTTNTSGSLLIQPDISGVLLNSYSQFFTFELKFTTKESTNVDLSVLFEISNGRPELEFPLSPKPSVNISTYKVLLHEKFCKRAITAPQLQESLAHAVNAKLKAVFKSSGSMGIVSAKLGTAIKGASGEYAGNVENCTCNEGNYTGLSCQLCSQGYTRFPNMKTPVNPPRYNARCELCSCTNRSKDCDAETGQCTNCRTGSKGYFCGECQNGVDNRTDCMQCRPGYYGLYLNKFSGCGPCNCILSNTLYGNQSVCAFDDGQCNCKGNISGRICDRCHENAYNNTQGQCIDCPICYRLLQVFVHELRRNITKLEGALDSLRNGGSGDETFETRLVQAERSVRLLVDKAKNSTGIEQGLHDELVQLNQTLDTMEALLKNTVTPGVTSLEGVVTTVSRDRSRTAELIATTEKMVNDAYALLNSSIKLLINQAEQSDQILRQIKPSLEAFRVEALNLTGTQNSTAQDIITKTNMADKLVRDSNSISSKTLVDHNKNVATIHKLLADYQVAKNLAIQTNSTANVLLKNSTTVLKNAKLALDSDMALNTTNKAELRAVVSTMQSLTNNATTAIKDIERYNNEYKSVMDTVETSVRETAVIMAQVTSLSQDATWMLNEAKRAEAEAKAAVSSASKTHQDAKDMLEILQTFKTKANQSQQLAATALDRSKNANQTSRDAIAYSERINASIQATLKIAMQGINTARRARDLSKTENQDITGIHSQATVLQNTADKTKHTPENFRKTATNVNTTKARAQQPIDACRVTYTRYSKDAQEKSTKALNDATRSSTSIINAKKSVDGLHKEFARLQKVNATRLKELQDEVKRLRTSFEQKDITTLNDNLQAAKIEQQKFVDSYKLRVQELRQQVDEMKELSKSLKTVPFRGCT